MLIQTARSRASNPKDVIAEIAKDLQFEEKGKPDFLAVHFGVGTNAADLAVSARQLANTLHGGSSCLGIMTQTGVDIGSGNAVGAFAIWDPAGSYGTASSDLGDNASDAASKTTLAALAAAGRDGEIPDLVWLTVAPGREEQVLDGIRAVLGSNAVIVGGSSADNDVSGSWAQFGPKATHGNGIVVSVLFPSVGFASSYHSGYAQTGTSGLVTRVERRRLYEIDHKPAAEVYNEWTSGAVPIAGKTVLPILADATLWPLGRVTRHVSGVPFHLLAHPAAANPDGSIELFADVAIGDRLWQMRGSSDSLVARAGRIAEQARYGIEDKAFGALVVYCGGCMLSVQNRMDEVQSSINSALGNIPWLGIFTFGEQGMPAGDLAKHGNLMISCTAFGD